MVYFKEPDIMKSIAFKSKYLNESDILKSKLKLFTLEEHLIYRTCSFMLRL